MFKITLAAARVNAGLRQNIVAQEMGVSVRTLVRWEKYLSSPNGQQIERLCKLYECPIEVLILAP